MGAAIYHFFQNIFTGWSWPSFVSQTKKFHNFYLHQNPCGKFCFLQPHTNDLHPSQLKNFIMPLCGLSKPLSQCNDDELDERDLYTLTNWLHDEANILTSRAVRYAKLFIKDGLTNMKRIAKHVHRHPNYLKELHIIPEDIDEINEAVGASTFVLKRQNVEDHTKLDTIYHDVSNSSALVMTDNPLRDGLAVTTKKLTRQSSRSSQEDDTAVLPSNHLMEEFDACLLPPPLPASIPVPLPIPIPTVPTVPIVLTVNKEEDDEETAANHIMSNNSDTATNTITSDLVPPSTPSAPATTSMSLSISTSLGSSNPIPIIIPITPNMSNNMSNNDNISPTATNNTNTTTMRKDSEDFGYDTIYGNHTNNNITTGNNTSSFSSPPPLPISANIANNNTINSIAIAIDTSNNLSPVTVTHQHSLNHTNNTITNTNNHIGRRYADNDNTTPPPGSIAALTALWASRSTNNSTNNSRANSRCSSPITTNTVNTVIGVHRSKSCSHIVLRGTPQTPTGIINGIANGTEKKKFKFAISPSYVPSSSSFLSLASASTTPTNTNTTGSHNHQKKSFFASRQQDN